MPCQVLASVALKYVWRAGSARSRWGVSLKPDRNTADKTAKINSDGRALCITERPHTMSSAHQTVTLLATVAWARVSGQERIQEAQLSLTNCAMLVCKVVEVWQDFLSEYVDKKFTRTYATDGQLDINESIMAAKIV